MQAQIKGDTDSPVCDVVDITTLETVTTPWGAALLLPGMKKLTAPDGTVFGVSADDYAANWQQVA